EGGALYLFAAGGVEVQNTVLWGNAAPVGPEVHVVSGGPPVAERSIVAGGCPTGAICTDILDTDPRFVREPSPGADGTWGTEDDDYGDLGLSALSPGLDAGLTSLLPPDTWDLDGDGDTAEPLPLDAAGSPRVEGSEVDLGAYERAAPAVAVEAHSAADVPLIPAGGGQFAFTVRLVNGTSQPQTVEAGVAAYLPDGSAYGPFRSRAATVPAGGEVVVRLVQTVPGVAPSGEYEYVVFTGAWPEAVESADAFGFRKAPGAARGRPVGGGWSLGVESVEEAEARAPASVAGEALTLSVAPNPVRDRAVVALTLPRATGATVALYDGLGRQVAVLHEGVLEAGVHEVPLDARGFPVGVYVLRVQAWDVSHAERVTLVR
ncbi:MAG: T9SS type A sorting domain-containing protein, partial [Rubricoccaceae bacterium]|nr:T9SS type A sorting domain-containing protein [Rubricoccaceae bacterium]